MASEEHDRLEELLRDLKSQYNKPDSPEISQEYQEIDSLFDEVKSELKANKMSTEDPNHPVTPNHSQVDDYLDSIKAQHQKQSPSEISEIDRLKSQYKSHHTVTEPHRDRSSGNNSSIEDPFASIKAQHQKQSPNEISEIDRLKSQYKSHHTVTEPHRVSPNNPQLNNSLDAFKQKYKHEQSWQKNQAELNYNHNQQEIIRQEQQKQLKRKQLTRQAETWLENLDPYSDEGMWFNQLAESYPSRLEAAISYLSASE